jgi:hypothetical protein
MWHHNIESLADHDLATTIVDRGTVRRPILHELRQMRRLENPMSLALISEFGGALRSLLEVSSITIERGLQGSHSTHCPVIRNGRCGHAV